MSPRTATWPRTCGSSAWTESRTENLTIGEVDISPERLDQAESGFSIDEGPRVTLRLPATRMILLDGVPTDSVVTLPDESMEVTLPVSSTRWLERLLVRIGGEVEVLAADDVLGKIDATTAAKRVRDRYR